VKTIFVELGDRRYPIHVGAGLLGDRQLYAGITGARQILVVSNEIVAPLYLASLLEALEDRDVGTVILPDGEANKTLASFAAIIDELVERGFHRDACLIALGGGIVGDVAGFAAACYQRGIDFVQVPTTVLAQVDSAVGGKTAVNHPRAKNMIGAFHQPIGVISDIDTLTTLPERELAAGLAEVIKYGLIQDREFLNWLEQNIERLLELDVDAMTHAIVHSCEVKAAIVAEDERELGRRALLNLGHTFGHALEALGGYERWLHGEAIAIGTQMAANVSAAIGRIDADTVLRVRALLQRAGLPVTATGITPDQVLERMQLDKKAGQAGMRLVLLQAPGEAVVVPAPPVDVLRSSIAAQLEDAK
jgi:3-dehydroquinate synthase